MSLFKFVCLGLIAISLVVADDDVSEDSETQDTYFKLTGQRDTQKAIDIIGKKAGLKNRNDIDSFVKKCRGNMSWNDVFNFMNQMQGSTDITFFTRILIAFTNKTNGLQAYQLIGFMTNHEDMNGIINVLYKISSKNNLQDLAKYYHDLGNGKGVDAVEAAVTSFTATVGPADFVRCYEQLAVEDDVSATMQVLTSAMGTKDFGSAILQLTKLLKQNSFADCMYIIKQITRDNNLLTAIQDLTSNSGQTSLQYIVDDLYNITNTQDLSSANISMYSAFQLDTVSTFKQINIISKGSDPLGYCSTLLQLTLRDNIVDACADVRTLTTQNMTTLEFMGELQKQTQLDAIEIFKKLILGTNSTSLAKAWQLHASLTGLQDFFQDIALVKTYTKLDLITLSGTVLLLTNTVTFQDAIGQLDTLTETHNFFEALEAIHQVKTDMDVVDLMKKIASVTSTNTLVSGYEYVKKETGLTTFLECLKYVVDHGTQSGSENSN